MYPMRGFTASGWRTMSTSKTRPAPALGRSTPQSIRINVDFPDPLGPSSPKMLCRSTRRLTASTATTVPNRRDSPSVSITGSLTNGSRRLHGPSQRASSSITSPIIPGRSRSLPSSTVTLIRNTCLLRSSGVWVFRGVNSASVAM